MALRMDDQTVARPDSRAIEAALLRLIAGLDGAGAPVFRHRAIPQQELARGVSLVEVIQPFVGRNRRRALEARQGLVDLAESHQHLSQLVQRLGVIGTLDKRFLVCGLRRPRIGR